MTLDDVWLLVFGMALGLGYGILLVLAFLWARDRVQRRRRHAAKVELARQSMPPLPNADPVPLESWQQASAALASATLIAHRAVEHIGLASTQH